MSEFNLPDGITSSMIPGNRPQDTVWEQVCEELDAREVLDIHDNNVDKCDFSAWNSCGSDNTDEPTFAGCCKGVVNVAEDKVVGEPLHCPYVCSTLENKAEDREYGYDDQKSEPEYWDE